MGVIILKKYLRFFCSFFCSLILISSQALAAPATASEWATPSELPMYDVQNGINSSLGISTLVDAPTVSNTVDYSGVFIQLFYDDMSGVNHVTGTYAESDGQWSISRPNDFAAPTRIVVGLDSGSIPSLGKYTASVSLRFNAGVTFASSPTPFIWTSRKYSNAQSATESYHFDNYITDLDAWGSLTVDINTTLEYFTFNFPLSSLSFNTSGYANGTVAVNFTRLSSSASTDTGVAGGDSVSDSDISQSINNSVGDISSGVSSIGESIRELIQTIINQLNALWNQFAGEFTNMFTAWQTHTNAIVSAIQNITVTASDGIQNIIDAGHDDADQIQENQDQNTDTIVNGYDNSSMTQENDRLNDSLSQLEDAEDQLFDDAKNYINDFEFENPFTQFTAPLSDLSYWLVGIYDGLGSMNIPISFGFTLSIALLLIGWYRFKGGV